MPVAKTRAKSQQSNVGNVCQVGSCPDLAELSDMDRRQAVLSTTARFASTYLRWLDTNSGDGLTFHRLMLIRVLHSGGPAIMSELASALGVSARNMTAIVDGLEREQLVTRRPHPTDRRATLVVLTPDGSSTVHASSGLGIGALGGVFDELNLSEQQQFLEMINRLMGVIGEPTGSR